MAIRFRTDTIALVVSLLALSISGWMLVARQSSPENRLGELRDAQSTAVAKSELASNRAQCFLRISGKDTAALARLHTALLARNKTILDSHRDQMSASELASADKLAKDMLIGAAEVEQQVTLTKQSMSQAQLALASRVCPGEG